MCGCQNTPKQAFLAATGTTRTAVNYGEVPTNTILKTNTDYAALNAKLASEELAKAKALENSVLTGASYNSPVYASCKPLFKGGYQTEAQVKAAYAEWFKCISTDASVQTAKENADVTFQGAIETKKLLEEGQKPLAQLILPSADVAVISPSDADKKKKQKMIISVAIISLILVGAIYVYKKSK